MRLDVKKTFTYFFLPVALFLGVVSITHAATEVDSTIVTIYDPDRLCLTGGTSVYEISDPSDEDRIWRASAYFDISQNPYTLLSGSQTFDSIQLEDAFISFDVDGGWTNNRRDTSTGQFVSDLCFSPGTSEPIPSEDSLFVVFVYHKDTLEIQHFGYMTLSGSGEGTPYDPGSESSEPANTPTTQYIDIVSPTFNQMEDSSVDIEIDVTNPRFGGEEDEQLDVVIGITDYVTGTVEYSEIISLNETIADTIVYDTVDLTDGSKFLHVYFNGSTAHYYEVAQSFFNVNENTYLAQTGIETPTSSTGSLGSADCGTWDIGCQLQRLAIYLFYPSEMTVEKFKTLPNLVMNTSIFNLMSDIQSVFNATEYATEQQSFSISIPAEATPFDVEIPIMRFDEENQFISAETISFLRFLLGTSVYMALLFYLFNRLRYVDLFGS